ncbi:hypothetical protein [Nocardia sp. NRRL S-836]|uniref:hypothetical protein n=1 Tax=Nocardia sp. NRRL S-836 TaxID=1519492 RepID=UPI0006ADD07C|nr:hypothetical protein [Nocardia sp. NRRL S-836]KOV77636.1 hypothetical protein ADL03_41570 [Nocardia sp. NRRL S-836]
MDSLDAELAITATEASERVLSLLPSCHALKAPYDRICDLASLAAGLRIQQRVLEDAIAVYSRPLVSGRLDQPGPIATSLINLTGQLSRVALLLHELARTVGEDMTVMLRSELLKVADAASAVIAAVTPHNFAGIRAFVDNEWLGPVLTKMPAS